MPCKQCGRLLFYQEQSYRMDENGLQVSESYCHICRPAGGFYHQMIFAVANDSVMSDIKAHKPFSHLFPDGIKI